DAVPAGTTFVSASQTAGPAFVLSSPPAGGSGTFTATDATLAAGGLATFRLVVHANSSDAGGSTITNTATVSTTTTDSNAANNSSSTSATVAASADMGVTKTGPATVTAGTNFTYTITVTNGGPSDAQNVTVTDSLPAGTTFVSESQTSGPAGAASFPAGGGPLSITFATFAAGQAAVFQVVLHDNAAATSGSTITNTATVASSTPDTNPANNTSTTTATVATSADVAVTKTAPATATAGTNFTYTVSVTNNGPSDAQNVMLTDALPSGVSFQNL